MTDVLLIATTAVIALVVIAAIAGGMKSGRRVPETYPYVTKGVMTEPEQVLYYRLIEALPEHVVLAQVQMSSFLKIRGRQTHWKAVSSRIREKSADFLICDKTGNPVAMIELQDRTHERPERIKSDEFKRKAAEAARLKLVTFHVGQMPSVEEIRKAVTG